MHRYADLVKIAIRPNLTNSLCFGIIQTDNARLYKPPTYYAQQLYAQHAGARPLVVETEGRLERNDVSATLSRGGSRVVVFVVNGMRKGPKATLDLSHWAPPKQEARVWTLLDTRKAGERDVINGFDDPERVRTVASSAPVSSAKLSHTFPALSLTLLECEVARRG